MKNFFTLTFIILSFYTKAQISVGDAQLQINLQNNSDGFELSGITSNGTELLEQHSYIFYLYLTNINTQVETRLSATSGWQNINIITNTSTDCSIRLTNPNISGLNTLTAEFTLHVANGKSQWDLEISGIGNDYTLTRVNFPKFKIKTPGNDTFLIPKFSGKEEHNPNAGNISYDLTYPRGRLGASMPFASYYNTNYGIYLAFHDPNASLKNIVIQSENNYVKYYGKHNIPNKTLPNNNWELPGVFELDIFQGNWYDSAMIYKEWAENNADYFPQETPERTSRQTTLGNIAIWGVAHPALTRPLANTETDINDFIALFPSYISVGIHWYKWNLQYHDENYPDFFPERTGFDAAIQRIQQNGNVVMPYINAMLYDTELPNYNTDGYPYATKNADGDIYSLIFSETSENRPPNTFAIMCPSQTHWQDTLVSINNELANRLDCKGIYNDMVGWAGATECMDVTHGHDLATGTWWYNGYQNLYNRVHNTIPTDRFITVEGATDNLSGVIDGFLVGEWRSQNLVPAFQAIYGGKNQFFGVSYGGSTYNDPSFYAKFSSYFVNNIQPGRMFLWFAHDPNATTARPYILNLALMRHKLRNYMSFGTMQKPINVSGTIPVITSDWGGNVGNVNISALQKNVYKNKTGDSIAFVFSNASMNDNLNFSFDVVGNDYGLNGQLDVQLITQTTNQTPSIKNNSFTQNVSINALTSIAYLVTEHHTQNVEKYIDEKINIYPNPSTDFINIISKQTIMKSIEISNFKGQTIHKYSINSKEKKIDISNLSKGIYLIKIKTERGVYSEKIIKK